MSNAKKEQTEEFTWHLRLKVKRYSWKHLPSNFYRNKNILKKQCFRLKRDTELNIICIQWKQKSLKSLAFKLSVIIKELWYCYQYKWSQTAPSPLPELLEHNPVWKSLPADSNPLQHSVTPQLLQHQVGIHLSSLHHSREPTTPQWINSLCLLSRG